jgi:hypothetical protein
MENIDMEITIGEATFNKPTIINLAMKDGGTNNVNGCQIFGGPLNLVIAIKYNSLYLSRYDSRN